MYTTEQSKRKIIQLKFWSELPLKYVGLRGCLTVQKKKKKVNELYTNSYSKEASSCSCIEFHQSISANRAV